MGPPYIGFIGLSTICNNLVGVVIVFGPPIISHPIPMNGIIIDGIRYLINNLMIG